MTKFVFPKLGHALTYINVFYGFRTIRSCNYWLLICLKYKIDKSWPFLICNLQYDSIVFQHYNQ